MEILSVRTLSPVMGLMLLLACGEVCAAVAPATITNERRWRPARDEVYLQETGRKIPTTVPLTAVAVYEDKVYAGSAKGLHELRGNELADVPAFGEPVNRVVVPKESLWVMTSDGLWRFQRGVWKKVSAKPAIDLCEHLGEVVVAQANRLWRVHGETLEPLTTNESAFAISRVLSHCETLFVQGVGRLTFVEGRSIGGRDVYDSYADAAWDWGALPSSN